MIIAGDIACPTVSITTQLQTAVDNCPSVFAGKAFVCNLEGLISESNMLNAGKPVLYNHSSVIGFLKSFPVAVACLANNHVLDIPQNLESTIDLLNENNINVTGAGTSLEAAHQPALFKDGQTAVAVFNECWDFLLYHQKNPSGTTHVATIRFDKLVDRVKKFKEQNPATCILVYLHWSLDLEILPYPMYREFARHLVDAGAAVVAGCHSHCVQGGEKYNDGYIIYGLGNFFLPNNVFANGKLFFPAFAATQLVLEFEPASGQAICHWLQYEKNGDSHSLKHLSSDFFEQDAMLKEYSPYQEMPQKKFVAYFKKNRRKKILIPVFRNYQNKTQLAMLTRLLKIRATFARMMARMNIIKWGS